MHVSALSRVPVARARAQTPILAAGLVSLAAYLLLQFVAPIWSLPYTAEMFEAGRIMQEAVAVTRAYCDSAGIGFDASIDPNRTCLIGPEYSELMTTLGHIEAKRTTTDPAVASLIVHLLTRAGVSRGDTIAIGASASFPALLIASLAAARAMGVFPISIVSLGASSYGATNVEFNFLDLYRLLLREGIVEVPPAAVSLGGRDDAGSDFDPKLRSELIRQIEASGLRFFLEPDMRRNVAARMRIYESADRAAVAAFVNTGGSHANLGTSPLALEIQPGLNTDLSAPAEGERGVLFEMAARGVPVVHLLFIRGLALRHGLKWDPVPLSEPGEVSLFAEQAESRAALLLIGVPFFATLLALAAFATLRNRRTETTPSTPD